MKSIAFTTGGMLGRSRNFLLASVVVTVLLYAIPGAHLLAYPFVLLSTLAHEMGHGLTGLLVGATFDSFQMYSDGSGVAHVYGNVGRMSRALIAAGGLIGPALFAALFFIVARKQALARFVLTILGVALIVAEFMVVRNAFGWVFVGAVAGVCLFAAQQQQSIVAPFTLVFIALQLTLSVFSRGDYLFTPTAQTANGPMPSDVAAISDALFLPYWFWGGLCALISGLVLIFGLKSYIRK
jgi:hypothetical protein